MSVMANPECGTMVKTETSTAFSKRMNQVLSNGFVTLGLCLGSKLGLFELMSKFNKPMTVQEIAHSGGFKETYIKEWLGLMAVADIVEVDPEGKTYYFPDERRGALAGPGNSAKLSELIPLFPNVHPELMECFKNDGPNGIPYSKYTGLHEFMEAKVPADSCSEICGIQTVHDLLEQGVRVADMGSSTGITTQQLAIKYPKSTFTGMDIAEDAIFKGQVRIENLHLTNISLMVQDICKMPSVWVNSWDCAILREVAHDVPFTQQMFREVYRILRPGGLMLLIDIDLHSNVALNLRRPDSSLIYCGSLHHCKPVSLSVEGGEGWGSTWGKETAIKLVENAGFSNVEIKYSKGMHFYCVGWKNDK